MKLTIDIGNTRTKMGVFNGDTLLHYDFFMGHDMASLSPVLKKFAVKECIVSSTVVITEEMRKTVEGMGFEKTVFFDYTTPIPIRNLYESPKTLGTDRLAAAIGANSIFPGKDILIIDMGTTITYDIVTSQNEYLGGNISPGIDMRFKALHKFTAKLPIVDVKGRKTEFGVDTETAIRCGVLDGIKYEIESYIRNLTVKYPYLFVFLTGGSDINFEECAKKRIFVDDYLVLKGLNKVLG